MTIVEKIWALASVGAQYPNYPHDTVTLTWEERRQGHGKRRSDGGIVFAISLPDGAVLKSGDCFILEEERTIVKVREALEPVDDTGFAEVGIEGVPPWATGIRLS
jgi:urease accessory protein UreE